MYRRVPSRLRRTALMAPVVALILMAAACGGGGDDQDGATGDGATTTTAVAGDNVQILVTNADGLGAPGLDALVNGTYVLPGVAVTVAAPAPVDPVAPVVAAGAAPVATFSTTASGYPAVAVQADPTVTVTAGIAGQLEGVPAGIDLVIAGINDGPLIGPLGAFDADIGAATAAATAGTPALVVGAGLDESPPDYLAVVEQVGAWVDEHRAALHAGEEPAQVNVLNVPGCGFGEARGVQEVPVATDEAGRDLNAVDCGSTLEGTADDIDAFINGFATLSVIPVAPPAD